MAIGLFDDGFAFGSPTGFERTVRANDGAEIESRKSEYLVSSPRGGGRRSSTSSTRWRRKRTRTGEVGIGQGSRNDEPRKHRRCERGECWQWQARPAGRSAAVIGSAPVFLRICH